MVEKYYQYPMSPKWSPPKGFHLSNLPTGTTTESIKGMLQQIVPDIRDGELQVQTLRDDRPENIHVNVRVNPRLYREIGRSRKRTLDNVGQKPVKVRDSSRLYFHNTEMEPQIAKFRPRWQRRARQPRDLSRPNAASALPEDTARGQEHQDDSK